MLLVLAPFTWIRNKLAAEIAQHSPPRGATKGHQGDSRGGHSVVADGPPGVLDKGFSQGHNLNIMR